MLELLLIIVFGALIFWVGNIYFSIFVLPLLLLLVLPGIYSMLFGAPYIPTAKKRRKIIMDFGDFKSGDRVYELGCGNGAIINEVADRGVNKAVGYEFSLPTYLWARLRNRGAVIKFADFWKQDYSDADIIICFLLKDTMLDFEEKIWPGLKKGAKVISNTFTMKSVEAKLRKDSIYLYEKNY